MQRSFICGLAGGSLADAEKRFLAEACPIGVIIFARNVQAPDQLQRLIADARNAAGRDDFLVLIDQEGGRVQRLGPPHWRRYPAAQAFAQAGAGDETRGLRYARLCAQLIAQDLRELGVNTSCAPVLDIPIPGADKIIGDRAYGADAPTVIRFGRAVADGLLAGGVLPVMKHIPGHGRAKADSHLALPMIEAPIAALQETDFAPFAALRDLPMAMTAHVVLTDIDPRAPVTVSKTAISQAIRGMIGFGGLLMTDDLSMRALAGSLGGRTRAAFEAGCDVALHCNGKMDEMEEVASHSPVLEGEARTRFEVALAFLKQPEAFDLGEAELALADSLAAQA